MGYTEKNLTDGERIVYRTKKHWFAYAKAMLLFFVGVAVCAFALCSETVRPFLGTALYCGYAVMIASFLWFVAIWLDVQMSEFVLTNKRVIMKSGLVHPRITEMQLNCSGALRYVDGLFGNVLGFGTIVVSAQGGSSAYDYVTDIERFQQEVNKLSKNDKK